MSAVTPPPTEKLRIVILGLSITSSWGNGHATTYRGLMRALCRRGHEVLFLERDTPWYRNHRDLSQPPFGATCLYHSIAELHERWRGSLRDADLIVIGSYVPDGIAVAGLVQRMAAGLVAFYDIDTPVTLAALAGRSIVQSIRTVIAHVLRRPTGISAISALTAPTVSRRSKSLCACRRAVGRKAASP